MRKVITYSMLFLLFDVIESLMLLKIFGIVINLSTFIVSVIMAIMFGIITDLVVNNK